MKKSIYENSGIPKNEETHLQKTRNLFKSTHTNSSERDMLNPILGIVLAMDTKDIKSYFILVLCTTNPTVPTLTLGLLCDVPLRELKDEKERQPHY